MAQFLRAQNSLKEKNMERLPMKHLQDLIDQLKVGDSHKGQ